MKLDIATSAELLATKAHAGQMYRTGANAEPYIYHPRQVADFARRLGYDERVVAAAYLHDVLEDTDYPEADMRKEFGDFVTNAVVAVSYLESDKLKGVDKIAKARTHIAGHVVKLCDSSCNLANTTLYGPKPDRNQTDIYDRYMKYLDGLRLNLPSPEEVAANTSGLRY